MEVEVAPQQTQIRFLTLSQLSERIRRVLSKEIMGEWVQAEIVRMNPAVSGHCYLDLVEKDNTGVKAKAGAVIWRDKFRELNQKFKNVTTEELRDGMKVLLQVTVNYHAEYGLKLEVLDIEPKFTLGEMMLTRRRTIERLHAEDSINRNKLLSFPILPKRIAIISSEKNEGYLDFTTKINERKEFAILYDLFSSHIDGDIAIKEIIVQLEIIRKDLTKYDVVVIVRGGNNPVGLHCYDNYDLAKTVALFPIPVLTGISHSSSDTVVETVAHVSKITPTDLAYFILGKFESFNERISTAKRKLLTSLDKRLKFEEQRLKRNQDVFTTQSNQVIQVRRMGLDSLQKSFTRNVSTFFERARTNLERSSNSLKYKPTEFVKTKKQMLSSLVDQFEKNFTYKFKLEKIKLDGLEKEVRHKSPEIILARGYSITFHNGIPVKDAATLPDGAVLQTQVYKGEIFSHVKIEKP